MRTFKCVFLKGKKVQSIHYIEVIEKLMDFFQENFKF